MHSTQTRCFVASLVGTFLLVSRIYATSATPAEIAVYWDVHPATIGSTTAYTPSGRYSVLVDYLQPLGYRIVEGYAPLDSVDLTDTSIMVIADGSDGLSLYATEELDAISEFVRDGGGLLIMSDVNGSSGTARMQQVLGLFGAQVLSHGFSVNDVYSTSLIPHPALAGVNEIYLRYSSVISPGVLTPYAFHRSEPMFAAGEVGRGRVALIADGDLFTAAPGVFPYFDRADNRQFAASTFAYLAVPEPSQIALPLSAAFLLLQWRANRGVRLGFSRRYRG